MINLVLSLQTKLDSANKHVLEEIHKISDPFLKLQFKLAVSQEVNSFLLNKLSIMKRQCWANALYSRREYLDIIGIPSKVNAYILKEKMSTFLVSFVVIPLQSKLKPAIKSAKKKLNHHCQIYEKERLSSNLECQEGSSKNKDGDL